MKFVKQIFFFTTIIIQIPIFQTLAMEASSQIPQTIADDSQSDKEIVDIFAPAKPNTPTKKLLTAVRIGSKTSLIPKFIELGANPACLDENQDTPLHYAAAEGNITAIKILTQDPRVNVNAVDIFGDTPLHSAIRWGRDNAVQALLSNPQIKLDIPNILGLTPLQMAFIFGRNYSAQMIQRATEICFLSNPSTNLTQELINAIKTGVKAHLIPDFIEHGANVNYFDENGNTPLHLAAETGDLPTVNCLLNNPNVNVNAENIDHNTPLHLAVQNGHHEVASAIAGNANALVNKRNSNGETPIQIAIRQGDTTIVFALSLIREDLTLDDLSEANEIPQLETQPDSVVILKQPPYKRNKKSCSCSVQ